MQNTNNQPTQINSHRSNSDSGNNHDHQQLCSSSSSQKWASKLLKECAKAISEKDSTKIHQLLWMLNELASPYGDFDQKMASYFLQALFCKATESGQRCYKTLTSVAEKTHNFDSARKLILKFQEVSPWTTFGHVASNGAILEAMEGESKLHIIDISNTLCTQWPTLLEAIATKNNDADTPFLKLTCVVSEKIVRSVMKEVGQRMEKFARLMGVPFEFRVVSGLKKLNNLRELIKEGEAIAVNCVGGFRKFEVEERGDVIKVFKSLGAKIVTVVEEEADFCSSKNDDFVKCFEECLRFYTLYFEMLEESFVGACSHERLMLERECSRSIVRVLGCEDDEEINYEDEDYECERRERGKQWSERLKKEGFYKVGFSEDVLDDVKALLKRYRAGWELVVPKGEDDDDDQSAGIYLTWKEEPVVWASAWKP